MTGQTDYSQKGVATVEFSFIAMIVIVLALGIVEFGSLIEAQAVVTNVGREGGNLASRDLKTGQDLLDLLAASSAPLDFQNTPEHYKIYIAKANAAMSQGEIPTCTAEERGALVGEGVESPVTLSKCGLTNELYGYLEFDSATETAAISQFTIVIVYYAHTPVTPLAKVLQHPFFNSGSILNFDMPDVDSVVNYDSMLIGTTAIF